MLNIVNVKNTDKILLQQLTTSYIPTHTSFFFFFFNHKLKPENKAVEKKQNVMRNV